MPRVTFSCATAESFPITFKLRKRPPKKKLNVKRRKITQQAVRTIGRYRVRTFLMMLGILTGISSLAILTAVGEGTKRETMQQFKNMIGTFDTIIIRPGGASFRGMPTLVNVPQSLRFEDAKAIATELPGIKDVAEVQSAFDIDV